MWAHRLRGVWLAANSAAAGSSQEAAGEAAVQGHDRRDDLQRMGQAWQGAAFRGPVGAPAWHLYCRATGGR
eukprot:11171342-Lingulodinium_polyedra.AAC.1